MRQLAHSLVFELHSAIENLPGSTQAREFLVKRALEYLDSLAAEAADDPSLQRELVFAYVKIGNAQGNPNNANLGDTAGALQSYSRALAIAEQLGTKSRNDGDNWRALGVCLEKLADVQAATGDISAAVPTARRSLAAFAANAAAAPEDARAQRALAISYLKVGDVSGNPNFVNAGNPVAALQSYQSALTIATSLHDGAPEDTDIERLLGVIHERLGTMLLSQERSQAPKNILLNHTASASSSRVAALTTPI